MIRISLFCIVALVTLPSISSAQPPGGRGGPGGGGGPGGAGRGDDAFAERLLALDKDKDGGLDESELPEHMQEHFAASDANQDGKLVGDEVKSLAAHFGRSRLSPGGGGNQSGPGGRGGGRPEQGPGGRGGPGMRGGQGGGQGGGLGGGPGGEGPTAKDLVERAFSFDADKDGKLDRAELMKFAEEMVARRGPSRPGQGGRGGPGGRGGQAGGRGGPGGGQGGGRGRPAGERPARPQVE